MEKWNERAEIAEILRRHETQPYGRPLSNRLSDLIFDGIMTHDPRQDGNPDPDSLRYLSTVIEVYMLEGAIIVYSPNDQAQRPPPETPGWLQESLTDYLNRPTAWRDGDSLQRPD